jgi:hypothetical protein
MIKEDMRTWDYHCGVELFRVGEYMARLNEVNKEFWDIYEQKLMDEGLLKYMSESDCAHLIESLAKSGKGSQALFETMEAYIAKHYRTLNGEEVGYVIEALEVSGRGKPETAELLKTHPEYQEALRSIAWRAESAIGTY